MKVLELLGTGLGLLTGFVIVGLLVAVVIDQAAGWYVDRFPGKWDR